MNEFPGCEELINHPIVVLRDKKSKKSSKNYIIFKNPDRIDITKVIIDGCVIKSGLRCDYLLIVPDKKYYFIELKGNDIVQAINQLEQTILFVQQQRRINEKKCSISSYHFPAFDSSIQRKVKLFKAKNNAILIIRNSKFEHSI